jgi:hypothetical protein
VNADNPTQPLGRSTPGSAAGPFSPAVINDGICYLSGGSGRVRDA